MERAFINFPVLKDVSETYDVVHQMSAGLLCLLKDLPKTSLREAITDIDLSLRWAFSEFGELSDVFASNKRTPPQLIEELKCIGEDLDPKHLDCRRRAREKLIGHPEGQDRQVWADRATT